MIDLVLSLASAGAGAQPIEPVQSFDHGSFCLEMQEAAGQSDVQPGTVMDRWTKHGGIFVDCDHRSVDMRTLLGFPVTKSWLKTEHRHWRDDVCSDPTVAEATSNGWKVTATILVDGKVVAVFEARCGTRRD